METTLNNYTIDDFLKLKPIIYEYCCNLTQKRNATSWYRDFQSAKDLYQDVFLRVHDYYFNKPKEPIEEGKFIQIMKNCTYWTHIGNFKKKDSKVTTKLNRFEDSPEAFAIFDNSRTQEPKMYSNFEDSIDYKFYTKNLNKEELDIIELFLKGFTLREIDEKYNKQRGYSDYIIRQKLSKNAKKDVAKPVPEKKVRVFKDLKSKTIDDDVTFLKSKIKNYELIFNNTKFIKVYSLYLQGFSQRKIGEMLGKSTGVVTQEIFRINQKIKKQDVK